MTKGIIDDQRKRDMVAHMTKTFGNVTVGIHGQELPKFSSDVDKKEWWKSSQTFNPSPTYQSANEMQQKKKFWAKDDELKLADAKDEEAPVD